MQHDPDYKSNKIQNPWILHLLGKLELKYANYLLHKTLIVSNEPLLCPRKTQFLKYFVFSKLR